jgi:hypothetical protein
LLAVIHLRGRAEQWVKKFLKLKLEGIEQTGILDNWPNFKHTYRQIFRNTTEAIDAARYI